MGDKEDRRRNLRRRVFHRDGWQDNAGDWFTMCANGCGTVLSWATAGVQKRDAEGVWHSDNTDLVCKAGCGQRQAARVKAGWKRQQQYLTKETP